MMRWITEAFARDLSSTFVMPTTEYRELFEAGACDCIRGIRLAVPFGTVNLPYLPLPGRALWTTQESDAVGIFPSQSNAVSAQALVSVPFLRNISFKPQPDPAVTAAYPANWACQNSEPYGLEPWTRCPASSSSTPNHSNIQYLERTFTIQFFDS